MKHLLLLAPLALAGCGTMFGARSPFAIDRKADTVAFAYAWSSEASAIPTLVRRLRGDLETSWNAASTTAQSDRAAARAAKRSFSGHQFSRRWTTAGQTAQLLSLEGRTVIVSGGANTRHGAEAILWDRRARTEIRAERLFISADGFDRYVQAPFCVTLDGERAKRRGAPVQPGAAFSACPRPHEIAVVPADSDANRRFDRIRLIAAQGVAGSFAEGRYDIAVAVTPAMRAALKPAYRSSFEVAQPQ